MSAVPGAAARLWRDRPRLVALSLLGVVAVAASGLQTTAATVLQQTLDENWRGSYDILVTQHGKDPVRAGLLQSDALVDATSGRLSMADLALIRGVPGVEVAAPIGEVTFPGALAPGEPGLWLPVPVRPDASLQHPQAFRITVASHTDDGMGDRQFATRTITAFAYQPSFSQQVFGADGSPLLDANGQPVYATKDLADGPRLISGDNAAPFAAGDYDPRSGTIPLGLAIYPRPAANVVLVDPKAERALLGDAGRFLDPLIDRKDAAGTLPVVVQDRKPAVLDATVTVEEFDEVTPGLAGAEAEAQSGNGILQNGQIAPKIADPVATTPVADYDVDLSDGVPAFVDDPLLLGGERVPAPDPANTQDSQSLSQATAPRSVLRGAYTISDSAKDDGAGVTLAARGYATFDDYRTAPLSTDAPQGAVTDYARYYGAVGQGGPPDPHFEVVGSYRPEQLRAALGAAAAPLGGYDTVNPSVVADASGAPIAARQLATSTTGFGIPGTNDVAVASFDVLDGWNVQRPISAIRIRVAGIDDYTPAAQQKLLAAASALGSLGFTATIVAGSSPQQLPVLVTGYALAKTDSAGNQVIGDLGVIDQDWSRLGAVTQVDAAISATSVALLVVAVVAVGILLAAVQLGSIPARRAQAGVLRELGWRRRRIVGWQLSTEALGLAVLAAICSVAVGLSSVPLVAGVATGVALGLVMATSVIAVALGARSGRVRSRRTSERVRILGPLSFGARLARTDLPNSIALALAVLLITVSVAVAATVFVQGRQLAGPTLLGALASARGWLPQGVLAGVSLAAGVVLAVLSRRMGLERRREQWSAVRAMGWSTAEVTRAQLAELATSAVPGALAGVGLAGAVAAQLPGILGPVLAASAAAGVVAVAVVLLSGRRLS